jgi:hypothetical protein
VERINKEGRIGIEERVLWSINGEKVGTKEMGMGPKG